MGKPTDSGGTRTFNPTIPKPTFSNTFPRRASVCRPVYPHGHPGMTQAREVDYSMGELHGARVHIALINIKPTTIS